MNLKVKMIFSRWLVGPRGLLKKLPSEYQMVTLTYIKPTYLPTYVTVVTEVTVVTVMTVVTVVTN